MKGFFYSVVLILLLWSCNDTQEHMAPAIEETDSVPSMLSYGVNTLISDSGVMKYRIVAERWEVNEKTNPPKWTFMKGVFFLQFDRDFHIAATISADTAWYYYQKRLWELRGRVTVRNVNGTLFNSEELYWDQMRHELYSHKYSRLFTPERQLEGSEFFSDENMTRYNVKNTIGAFPTGDIMEEEPDAPPSPAVTNDSSVQITDYKPHPAPTARRKQNSNLSDESINAARNNILEKRQKLSAQ